MFRVTSLPYIGKVSILQVTELLVNGYLFQVLETKGVFINGFLLIIFVYLRGFGVIILFQELYDVY